MSLLGLSVLSTVWLAAVEAPITSVTVYGDQARVVRTARVTLSGPQSVELPPLYGPVDSSSIRVEARGAEVVRVDIHPTATEGPPTPEARRLVTELEGLGDQLSRVRAERDAYGAQLAALDQVRPRVSEEPSSSPESGAPGRVSRLDASGWRAAEDFVGETSARLQAKCRELGQREKDLDQTRTQRQREARRFEASPAHRGVSVTVVLSGQGATVLTLTYLTAAATWIPAYEVRLEPESLQVRVTLAGRVRQTTGEDWEGAALTLSTALPVGFAPVPRLATWKIGQRERFIPTPARVADVWRNPLPAPAPPPKAPDEDARLREQLLALAPNDSAPPASVSEAREAKDSRDRAPQTLDTGSTAAGINVDQDFLRRLQGNRPGDKAGTGRVFGSLAEAAPGASEDVQERDGFSEMMVVASSEGGARERVTELPVGLAPPGGWRPPALDPERPEVLAGGQVLSFPAQRHETVRSGDSERRIPLLTETWPVQLEREFYPALTPNAFLVAQLRSPSARVLPGGEAQLFSGADPVGQAKLGLVSPGEPFTLPLGIDPAVRPVRNVQLVTSERGFIGKDELTEYRVTMELANPHPEPITVRVHEQWPLSRDGHVEVKLLSTEPYAEQDADKGTLLWRLSIPAAQKQTLVFRYSVRHPKGWRLQQTP